MRTFSTESWANEPLAAPSDLLHSTAEQLSRGSYERLMKGIPPEWHDALARANAARSTDGTLSLKQL